MRLPRSLDRSICQVGVFVNAPAEEIRRTADEVGLDLIQLHGDEAPEVLAELRGLPAMRAFRPDVDLLDRGRVSGRVSSAAVRAADGAGRCLARRSVRRHRRHGRLGRAWHQAREHFAGVPLVLAGGLTADNVAEAIRNGSTVGRRHGQRRRVIARQKSRRRRCATSSAAAAPPSPDLREITPLTA